METRFPRSRSTLPRRQGPGQMFIIGVCSLCGLAACGGSSRLHGTAGCPAVFPPFPRPAAEPGQGGRAPASPSCFRASAPTLLASPFLASEFIPRHLPGFLSRSVRLISSRSHVPVSPGDPARPVRPGAVYPQPRSSVRSSFIIIYW